MATLLRALVMLATLVGLPAAWIYYGPLPPSAQRVVDRAVAMAKETLAKSRCVGGVCPIEPLAGDAPLSEYRAATQSAPATTPAATAPRVALAQQLEPHLAGLRTLGANEYVLESWGDQGKLYRFRCELPVGAGSQATEQFEAVDADPCESVSQVLADVAAWRAAHDQTRWR
ncbi:MAG TPA: hypothetical protein PKC18_11985 [Lacipirellulaceae bacterium]|nr:hypothetical protein [Lacipirellulaceae bacterium]